MPAPQSSPPTSPSGSPPTHSTQTPLSLDLSTLPPLTQPSPPSNTLIITNLSNPSIFHPASLSSLRQTLESISPLPLHSFSPLRSFQRLIISLPTPAAALALRSTLANIPIMGCTPRIYFGEPTPLTVDEERRYLSAPKVGKVWFISPPPSPPVGWEGEGRVEGAPNKEVWARDLAEMLGRLAGAWRYGEEGGGGDGEGMDGEKDGGEGKARRRRGTGTVVYEPGLHGAEEGLPAVIVDDTGAGEDGQVGDGDEEGGGRLLTHTARPPVELME